MAEDPIIKAGALIIERGISQVYERGRQIGFRQAKCKIFKKLLDLNIDEDIALKATEVTSEDLKKFFEDEHEKEESPLN
ncbi:MAG: hypothetical protein IJU40_03005 [Desulfovibrionaceae bacterium]|nr:hypothetical protein [Desulfovibrionaceae bacterium]